MNQSSHCSDTKERDERGRNVIQIKVNASQCKIKHSIKSQFSSWNSIHPKSPVVRFILFKSSCIFSDPEFLTH